MSLKPTRDLVLRKLRDCFPDSREADDALKILDTYGAWSWFSGRERVQLAILMLSHGDLNRLRQLTKLAKGDYRDVLGEAEYPEESEASSTTTSSEEMDAIRKRDRHQYEAWLRSSRGE